MKAFVELLATTKMFYFYIKILINLKIIIDLIIYVNNINSSDVLMLPYVKIIICILFLISYIFLFI